jgi:chloramphenicol 3-O phosphotransferase
MNQGIKYQIIYLNGPSSSGKSTLARALQNTLKEPFLVLGIDQVIYMMPEKMNDWHSEADAPGFSWHSVKNDTGDIIAYKIHTGSYGRQMVQALKDIVVCLARTGNNIIIDDVSFGKEHIDDWRVALKEFNVLWVGVYAPLEIIELREQMRGDRKIGSAKWQAMITHADVKYDVMIDTHKNTLEQNIEIVSKYFVAR